MLVGPGAWLVTPSSQESVDLGPILDFCAYSLGCVLWDYNPAGFYRLWYWQEALATCCPRAHSLCSCGVPLGNGPLLLCLEDWAVAR